MQRKIFTKKERYILEQFLKDGVLTDEEYIKLETLKEAVVDRYFKILEEVVIAKRVYHEVKTGIRLEAPIND